MFVTYVNWSALFIILNKAILIASSDGSPEVHEHI